MNEKIYYLAIGLCITVGAPIMAAILSYVIMENDIREGITEWYTDLTSAPWAVWGIGCVTLFGASIIAAILFHIGNLLIIIGQGIVG